MNSIGALRSVAPCASLLVGIALGCGVIRAQSPAACNHDLTKEQRIARFKALDREAETAMSAHRYTEARVRYQEGVCLIPDSARGWYGLGMAHAAAGKYVEARQALAEADRLRPTTPMPLIMQAHVNVSLKDIEALKANLRDAAARFPKDANAHATLARFLAEQNLPDLALAEGLRAQEAGGADATATVQLAGLENNAGAYQDAARLATSIENDPGVRPEVRAAAAGIAGLSLESLAAPDEAVVHLRKAIELDPGRENSYLALADLLDQMQRYGEAVEVLKEGQAKIPDTQAFLLPLGVGLVRAEKYQEGIAVLQALLRHVPDLDEAYLGLADAAHRMGNPAEEARVLRQLAQRKPDYPMIHVLIARAMLADEKTNYAVALSELQLAEKAQATDPEIFFLRGRVYLAQGKYQEALEPLQRATELRPLDPAPYYQLARAYQKLGKAELAREQFTHVKELEAAGAAKR